MTAPGQEPDEVTTAVPGGRKDEGPDLNAVGDNHMPDDLRRAERARSEQSPEDTDPGSDDTAAGSDDTEVEPQA